MYMLGLPQNIAPIDTACGKVADPGGWGGGGVTRPLRRLFLTQVTLGDIQGVHRSSIHHSFLWHRLMYFEPHKVDGPLPKWTLYPQDMILPSYFNVTGNEFSSLSRGKIRMASLGS